MNKWATLKYVRPIEWEEVFDDWERREAYQESWKRHWESRGFASWREWRMKYISPLKPEELEWSIYEITEPLKTVPFFYGVPSKSWIEKGYLDAKTKRLKDVVTLSIVTENDKIKAIKEDFPEATMLVGVVKDKEIILYEGMHRSCAIASWPPGRPFVGKVSIALAQYDKDLPTVGGNYKDK